MTNNYYNTSENASCTAQCDILDNLSPKNLEAIMNKVQDVNAYGTAFHGFGFMRRPKRSENDTDEQYIQKMTKSILTYGVLGLNSLGDYDENNIPKKWAKAMKVQYDNRTRELYMRSLHFNIIGGSKYYNDEKASRLNDCGNYGTSGPWYHEVALPSETPRADLVVLLNIQKFMHDGNVYSFEFSSKISKTNIDFSPFPYTDNGYMIERRVAPRFLQGLVFNMKRPMSIEEMVIALQAIGKRYGNPKFRKDIPFRLIKNESDNGKWLKLGAKRLSLEGLSEDEARRLYQVLQLNRAEPSRGWSKAYQMYDDFKLRLCSQYILEMYYQFITTEKDPKINEERAKKIAEAEIKVAKVTNDFKRLLPVYDLDGNLWWPKKMSYSEVKEYAERGKQTPPPRNIHQS